MNEEARQTADVATTSGIIGGAAGLMRMVVYTQYGGWMQALSIMGAAITLGVCTGMAIHTVRSDGLPVATGLQWAVIILVSLVARDVLAGLQTLGKQFAADPVALIQRVWAAIRGK
jgi:hypothetical protein